MFALRHAGAALEAWARLRGGSQRAVPEESKQNGFDCKNKELEDC
ncbi:putative Protein FAM135A-like protein, partial [Naja naja]